MAGKPIDPGQWRRLTKRELSRLGYSTKTVRYVEKWRRQLRPSSSRRGATPTISVRQYQQSRLGFTLEKRAKLFKGGKVKKLFGQKVLEFEDITTEEEIKDLAQRFKGKQALYTFKAEIYDISSPSFDTDEVEHWVSFPKMKIDKLPNVAKHRLFEDRIGRNIVDGRLLIYI